LEHASVVIDTIQILPLLLLSAFAVSWVVGLLTHLAGRLQTMPGCSWKTRETGRRVFTFFDVPTNTRIEQRRTTDPPANRRLERLGLMLGQTYGLPYKPLTGTACSDVLGSS